MKEKASEMLRSFDIPESAIKDSFSMFVIEEDAVTGEEIFKDYDELDLSMFKSTIRLREYDDGHFEFEVGYNNGISVFDGLDMLEYYIEKIKEMIYKNMEILNIINELSNSKAVRRKINLNKLT